MDDIQEDWKMLIRTSVEKARYRRVLLVGAVVACLSLLSCEQAEKNSSTSNVMKQALTKVKVGGAPAFELILPTLASMSQGYFRKQGLEIAEFIQGPGSDMRTALLSGDLDIGLLAFVHVPLARLKGQQVKIVGTVYQREIFSLLVREGLRNEVKTVADLRGKKIGVAKPGSGNWALASFYLSREGLNPERDVKFIIVGNNLQTVYNALKTERIDAYPTFEPQTSILIERGLAFPLVSIWDETEHRKWIGESAMSMVLAAKEDKISAEPILIQKFIDAHRLGVEYIQKHKPEQVAKELLENTTTAGIIGDMDQKTLAAVIRRIRGGYSTGALDRAAYNVEMGLYTSAGILKEFVPFEEATDTTFAGVVP